MIVPGMLRITIAGGTSCIIAADDPRLGTPPTQHVRSLWAARACLLDTRNVRSLECSSTWVKP